MPPEHRPRSDSGRCYLLDVLQMKSGLAGCLLLITAAGPCHAESNDYPTAARADYVIGCMAANGNTREALLKCSCAIDTIAGLMPYSRYEQAETALGLQAGVGEAVSVCPATRLSSRP